MDLSDIFNATGKDIDVFNAADTLDSDEQKAYFHSMLERTLHTTLAGGREQTTDELSDLGLDQEARQLRDSIQFQSSTTQTSEIIRKLLLKAGTDCAGNDADPYGDGDQRMVNIHQGGTRGQILRDLFARGGDLEHWLRERPNKLSAFQWMCFNGDVQGVTKILKRTPRQGDTLFHLVEARATSMRLPPLIYTIAESKNQQMIAHYSGRSPSDMDHMGVVRVLLRYGARPNARDVTGKTACHYGAGEFATKETLMMVEMAIKATETCLLVGKPVVLDGLSRKEYNGMEGILGGYVAESGQRVFHPSDPDKKEFSVKPENIFTKTKKDGNIKMISILDKLLRPTNLVNVRDRIGSISLHEVAMSGSRADVAKFLLAHSPTSVDVKDCSGISPRRMALRLGMDYEQENGVEGVIRRHVTKQSTKQEKKENLRRDVCEHCGKRAHDLGRELLQCTRCLDALYCCKKCQVADWSNKHKKECLEREQRRELVLGEPEPVPEDDKFGTPGAQNNEFCCQAPQDCKTNQKFWVKIQSIGDSAPLYIHDETRSCNFKLSPGSLGHKELVEKIATEKAFIGRKSYFRAKINSEGQCVVFPHTSTMLKW